MTSSRPYLIRAIYEWIADNDLTPQLIVNAELEDVTVPREYVSDGRIVLNVATRAVRDLVMDNACVQFSARFSGKPFGVYIPTNAILAVYAAETGVGMAFQDEDGDSDPPPSDGPKTSERPQLKVVK